VYIFLLGNTSCYNIYQSLKICSQLIAANEKLEQELAALKRLDGAASASGNLVEMVKEVCCKIHEVWEELMKLTFIKMIHFIL
jgi:hypothetical protein